MVENNNYDVDIDLMKFWISDTKIFLIINFIFEVTLLCMYSYKMKISITTYYHT